MARLDLVDATSCHGTPGGAACAVTSDSSGERGLRAQLASRLRALGGLMRVSASRFQPATRRDDFSTPPPRYACCARVSHR